MPEIPSWLQAAISSVIAAVITWFASRRLYRATVDEKDASTAKIWADVAADAVKQLKEVRAEIPGWMQKLAAETVRANKAEAMNATAKEVQRQAKIIVEEANHFSFMKVTGEPVSDAEVRFLKIKAAAMAISDLALKE